MRACTCGLFSSGDDFLQPVNIRNLPLVKIRMCAVLSDAAYHDPLAMWSDSVVKAFLDQTLIDYPRFLEGKNKSGAQAYVWPFPKSRTLVVVYRGTQGMKDIMTDLRYNDVKMPTVDANVHEGFYAQYTSVEAAVRESIDSLRESFDTLIVTGHSLGAALATLTAPALVDAYPNKKVELYTFGSPRVGNDKFVEYFRSRVQVVFRIANFRDPVALIPMDSRYLHVCDAILLKKRGETLHDKEVPPSTKRKVLAVFDVKFLKLTLYHATELYVKRINFLLETAGVNTDVFLPIAHGQLVQSSFPN